ncbi:MAG: group 1 truncated hemoglobin [Bacteroidetes bacterium]|nr:group 1 truncated hemoglobin [Bacteroidota bacterium]
MKKATFLPVIAIIAIASLMLSACSKKAASNPAPTMGTTLYDTLGGTTLVADPTHQGAMIEKGRLAIRNVIDSTIFVIAADSRINGHFTVLLSEVTKGDLSGFTDLSENLTTFVSGATGAKDYIYIGLSMHDAHDPATNPRMNGKATNADFDAFVSDLVAGANKNKVPSAIITSLGKIVESLRTTVVQM